MLLLLLSLGAGGLHLVRISTPNRRFASTATTYYRQRASWSDFIVVADRSRARAGGGACSVYYYAGCASESRGVGVAGKFYTRERHCVGVQPLDARCTSDGNVCAGGSRCVHGSAEIPVRLPAAVSPTDPYYSKPTSRHNSNNRIERKLNDIES